MHRPKRKEYRIVVLGGPGAGTTEISRALAKRLGILFLDSDDFLWIKTSPPYTTKRVSQNRLEALLSAIGDSSDWVIAGSLGRWADDFQKKTTMTVLIDTPVNIRLRRLEDREIQRFGQDFKLDHQHSSRFSELKLLSAEYDTAPIGESRSKLKHFEWMRNSSGISLICDGNRKISEIIDYISDQL